MRRFTGKEGHFDVFFADDLHDLLRIFRATIVDAEGKRVGSLARKYELASRELIGDSEARRDRRNNLNLGKRGRSFFNPGLGGKANGSRLINVKVRYWDVDVGRRCIASCFNYIPSL